eukprot:gnl/MRDRNA2_/MRDRNA2_78266_c0_seq2.p1 gnl/MRDRNA2_/MRDRNA2_78266_c0~~gnl/MRDRNA2_/MRDRNA2_78266_c0_seq2.p1  ORF type:complete len:1064 (-),score=190.00 gnl/MRDRNA2_/MRDRNA2_78266_c0_seq2:33-3224(-)
MRLLMPSILTHLLFSSLFPWSRVSAKRANVDFSMRGDSTQLREGVSQTLVSRAQLDTYLTAAETFVVKQVPHEEREAVRQSLFISGLDENGMRLEQQFQWFVLRAAVGGDVSGPLELEADGDAGPKVGTGDAALLELEANGDAGAWSNDVDVSTHDISSLDDEPTEAGPADMSSASLNHDVPKSPKVQPKPMSSAAGAAKSASLRDRWKRAAHAVNDLATELKSHVADVGVAVKLTDSAELSAAFSAKQAVRNLMKLVDSGESMVSKKHLSITMSTAHYRRWKRFRSMQQGTWLGSKTGVPQTHLARSRELLMDALRLNLELSDVLQELRHINETPWHTVKKQKGMFSKIAHSIGTWMKKAVSNTGKFFLRLWKAFRASIKTKQLKCQKQANSKEEDMAHKHGILRKQDYFDDKNDKSERVREQRREQLEAHMDRTDVALEELAKDGEGADDEMASISRETMDNFENLKNLSVQGGSNAQMDQAIRNASAIDERADDTACRNKSSSIFKKFKDLLRAMRNAHDAMLPDLGFRGVYAGLSILSGGLEEYVDFRNREIGWFKFNAKGFGASMATVGFGGYSGLGWKGYKQNWTLQEAIQTGLFVSNSINIPALPISFGFGYAFATDADDSSHPWIPEPQGVNAVSLGWSLSHGVNLGITVDSGYARYSMLTSMCFDNDKDFFWARQGVGCKGCAPGEDTKIGLMRAGIKLASFPLITGLIHDYLAWQNNRINRAQNHTSKCSLMSVKNRNNASHLAVAIGKELLQAAAKLKEIEVQLPGINESFGSAPIKNQDLFASADWRQVKRKLEGYYCKKTPPIMTVSGDDGSEVELNAEYFAQNNATYEQLQKLKTKELQQRCTDLHTSIGCRGPMGRFFQRKSLMYVIREHYTPAASAEQPFGRCEYDTDCVYKPNTKCECTGDGNNWHKTCKPRCSCAPGFCHALNSTQGSICEADLPSTRIARLFKELHSWSKRRRLALGSYASLLETITDLPIVAEKLPPLPSAQLKFRTMLDQLRENERMQQHNASMTDEPPRRLAAEGEPSTQQEWQEQESKMIWINGQAKAER